MLRLILSLILAASPLPTNSWALLSASNAGIDGVMAQCALGAATGTNSAWVAIAGIRSLDIVQIGAQHTPSGNRAFLAYGHGDPNSPDGAYTETPLGATDAGFHKYAVQLVSGAYSLSIDGATKARVPLQGWQFHAAEVANEVTTVEPMGGSRASPVICKSAFVHYNGQWIAAPWQTISYGPSIPQSRITFGIGSVSVYHA